MLQRILQALEDARGPVSLDALSRELGVERSALEGMIALGVRKGRLRDSALAPGCAGGCGSHCGSAAGCPFLSHVPRTIELVATASGAESSRRSSVASCQ